MAGQNYFDPFTLSSTGQLNPKAAMQQVGLLTALYWGEIQTSVIDIMSACGGGVILFSDFQPEGKPFSSLMFRNGTNYYLIIAGTVVFDQMLSNINGITGTPYNLAGNIYAHSYWLSHANRIKDMMLPYLPDDLENLKLSISGHSAGASIGFLIANDAYASGAQVELLTFGEPRSITENYQSAAPQHYRVVLDNDIVADLPPKNTSAWLGGTPLGNLFSRKFRWAHYGNRYNLSSSGTLAGYPDSNSDPDLEISDINSTNIDSHKIKAYVDALALEQSRSLRQGVNDFVAVRAKKIAARPEVEAIPATFFLKPSIYVDTNQADLSYFAGLPNVVTSAAADLAQTIMMSVENVAQRSASDSVGFLTAQTDNQRTITGAIMSEQIQVTMFFESGGSPEPATGGVQSQADGWSEGHYLVQEMDLATALKKAKNLVKKRAEMLGDNCDIVKVRVSSAVVKGDSQTEFLPTQSKNKEFPGGADSCSDFSDRGVNVLYTSSDLSRRVALMSGNPDRVQVRKEGTITDAAWRKAFKNYVEFLTSGEWGYRGKKKGEANPEKSITGIANIAGPPQSITLQIPAHGFAQNDAIDIYGNRGSGTNPNGLAQRVNVIDANSISVMGYSGNFDASKLGKARKVVYAVLPYAGVQLERFSRRKRGHPNA